MALKNQHGCGCGGGCGGGCGCSCSSCKKVGPPKATELAILSFVSGLDDKGCCKYMALEQFFDPCRLASRIPGPVLLSSFVGRDANGCLVWEENPIPRLESVWVGTSPLSSINIINGGPNGHSPQFDVQLAPTQNGYPNITSIIPGQGVYTPVGAGIQAIDTSTLDLTLTPTGQLYGDVKISTNPFQQIIVDDQGLYVVQGANAVTSGPVTGNGSPGAPIDIDFSLMTLSDRCAFGNNLPAGFLTSLVGRDINGCLTVEGIATVVPRGETLWTGTPTGGITITPGGVNGHAPTIGINMCLFGDSVSDGIVRTVLGRDNSACVVAEDPATFVARNETPWVGVAGAGISITPGGVNGHGPTISFNHCTVGSLIPAGPINNVVGTDGQGCLVYETSVQFVQSRQILDTTFAATSSGNGIDIAPGGQYGHTPAFTLDFCDMAAAIPAAAAPTDVVGTLNGCLVRVPISSLWPPETPWVGVGAQGITITAGGTAGHGPTIGLNFCALGSSVPAALGLLDILGTDPNGCIVKVARGLVVPPETPLTLQGGYGITVTPGGVNGHSPMVEIDCEDVQDCVATMFAPWGQYDDNNNRILLVPSTDPGNTFAIGSDGRPFVATVVIPPLDCEAVQDCVGGMFAPWGAYDDAGNKINFVPSTGAGNQLILHPSDGRPYVAVPAQTVLTAVDSNTIDFTTSGTDQHTITGEVLLAPQQGCAANEIRMIPGQGLFAPATNPNFAEIYDLTAHTLNQCSFPAYIPLPMTLTFTLCRDSLVNIVGIQDVDYGFSTGINTTTTFSRLVIDGVAQIPTGLHENMDNGPTLVGLNHGAGNLVNWKTILLPAGTHNVILEYRTANCGAPQTMFRQQLSAYWVEVGG